MILEKNDRILGIYVSAYNIKESANWVTNKTKNDYMILEHNVSDSYIGVMTLISKVTNIIPSGAT